MLRIRPAPGLRIHTVEPRGLMQQFFFGFDSQHVGVRSFCGLAAFIKMKFAAFEPLFELQAEKPDLPHISGSICKICGSACSTSVSIWVQVQQLAFELRHLGFEL